MPLSAEDAARFATVGEEWQALQDAVWAAEAGKDPLVATFAPALEAQLAGLRKAVAEARGATDNALLLDPNSDRDEAQVRACAACTCRQLVGRYAGCSCRRLGCSLLAVPSPVLHIIWQHQAST